MVVTFNANATAARTAALIRNISYENTDTDNPTTTNRTLRFTVSDGDGGTSSNHDAIVNITAVNDASTLAAIEGVPLAYTENNLPTAITAAISIADVDDTNIESATIQITGNYASGQDVLAFTDTPSITGIWNTGSGTMTLSGSDTLANYEAALRSVTYQNTSDNPSTPTRTVSFTVDDGDDPSNTLTRDINVTATNDASVLAAIEGLPLAYTENNLPTAITAAISIADVDDTNIESATIQITGNYASGQDVLAFTDTPSITGIWNTGSGTMTLSGSDTLANYEAALRAVTYQNTSDNPSTPTRTVSFTVDDGDDPSNTLTRDINVARTNDAPTISNLAGDSLSYNSGAGALVIEQVGDVLVSDVDSADFDTGNLTVSLLAGGDVTEDVLSVRDEGLAPGQIGFDGSNVRHGGVLIGTAVGGSGGTDLVISLNTNATPAALTALARNISYENTDTLTPTTGARTVRFTIDDGDGDVSPNYDTTVNVTASIAPTLANLAGDTLAYTEGDGARIVEQGTDVTVTDLDSPDFDSGNLTVSIAAGGDAAEDVLSIRDQGVAPGQIGFDGTNVTFGGTLIGTAVGGNGGADLVVTFNAAADATAAEALIANVTYENADTDDPTTSPRTIRFTLGDGDGASSGPHDMTVTVAAVNDASTLAAIEGVPLAYTEGNPPTPDHQQHNGVGCRRCEYRVGDDPDHRQLCESGGRARLQQYGHDYRQLGSSHRHTDTDRHGQSRQLRSGVANGYLPKHFAGPQYGESHRQLHRQRWR